MRQALFVGFLILAGSAAAQEHQHAVPDVERLGRVSFATSCSAAAQPQFNRAVALFHSFGFPQAIEAFTGALKTDPSCAMAEWGIAMCRWGNPFAPGLKPAAQLQLGRDSIGRARQIGAKTARERAYVDAVALLYTDFENVDQLYAKIAPSAPHALHMPSHSFTRVGSWQESIDTNMASSGVARLGGEVAEELHATDYQTYAYLQTAQDEAARRLLDSMPEIASRFNPDVMGAGAPPSAGFFAIAAIPARFALERGAWAEAARLEARRTRFPHTEAMTYFARALGAARSKDPASARAAIKALEQIRDQLTQARETYWAEQVEIQRRGASAWLSLGEGRDRRHAIGRGHGGRHREERRDSGTPCPRAGTTR